MEGNQFGLNCSLVALAWDHQAVQLLPNPVPLHAYYEETGRNAVWATRSHSRPEEEAILANLLELYAHDFSEFHDLEIGADGRFGYGPLALYWSEPGRHPFLVQVAGQLAGLVLVKRGSEVSGNESAVDMAEFFVLRGYRRRGIGTHVARAVWSRFPGLWEVRVIQSNVSAQHFWTRAIAMFAGQAIHPVHVEKNPITPS